LIFWCFHGPARIIERRFGFYVKQNFFLQHYRAVTELPLSWHRDHHSGDIINRIYKAGSGLYEFAQSQFMYLEALIRFSGAIIMLSIVSPLVGGMAIVGAIIIVTLIRGFDQKLVVKIHEQNHLEHFFSAGLHDFISNINTLITLRLAPLTQHELTRRIMAVFIPLKTAITLVEVKWFAFQMMAALLEAAIMLSFVYYQINVRHSVMMGTLVTVFQYFRQINMVFFSFSSFYSTLLRTRVDLQAVAPITEAAELLEKNHAPPMPVDWQKIELRQLHFSYDDGNTKTLSNLNVALPRGARIALVGESGAGKSSLLSVLRGIYPADADVEIDGAPTQIAMLADCATLIPQDAEIFENTIAENITMGVHDEDRRMRHAAAVAEFAPVAAQLPNSYDTDIREKGVNLSGGQKQRLALARGLFSAEDSSILLLDEPTSSVDAATELRIFQNLFAAYPRTTIVASLHRLHLLPRFDYIYVLDGGRIAEEGNFAALLAQGGIFKNLWDKYEQTT
jgi:ABC-type multidrug transport system fused ATPase/permease subunit